MKKTRVSTSKTAASEVGLPAADELEGRSEPIKGTQSWTEDLPPTFCGKRASRARS